MLLPNQVKFTYSRQGTPFWIYVTMDISCTGCLELWEAKRLRLELDEAIDFVEHQEELQRQRELAYVKKEGG